MGRRSLASLGIRRPRDIWWNFVASSPERIEEAKAESRAQNWGKGRFDLPVDERDEHIPLPDQPALIRRSPDTARAVEDDTPPLPAAPEPSVPAGVIGGNGVGENVGMAPMQYFAYGSNMLTGS